MKKFKTYFKYADISYYIAAICTIKLKKLEKILEKNEEFTK